jgi:predicted DsbA family dithiol-disulfide isomerase
VPFFIFNDSYAVSGAQPGKLFLQVLEQSYAQWKNTAVQQRKNESEK